MKRLRGYNRKWGMKTIYIVRKGEENKILREMLVFGKGNLVLAGLVWF